MTPTGGRPASRQRSTAASVWPERISTPPSRAISGKTWPGRTKSAAPMLPLASARTVLQRCSAEMPVVSPWRTSTETVKAVPSGASLAATIGARCSRRASSSVSGAQTMPQQWRMMKAIFSGVQSDAAMIEIAFVLAIVVVGDDDDLAAGDRLDGLGDGMRQGFPANGASRHSRPRPHLCRPRFRNSRGWRNFMPHRAESLPPTERRPCRSSRICLSFAKGKMRRVVRCSDPRALSAGAPVGTPAVARAAQCADVVDAGRSFSVCEFDSRHAAIKLFLRDANGEIYGGFSALDEALAAKGRNARLRHERRHVWRGSFAHRAFRRSGKDRASVNTRAGAGNFHMKPNGVFWVEGGRAGVTETARFLAHAASSRLRHPVRADAGLRRAHQSAYSRQRHVGKYPQWRRRHRRAHRALRHFQPARHLPRASRISFASGCIVRTRCISTGRSRRSMRPRSRGSIAFGRWVRLWRGGERSSHASISAPTCAATDFARSCRL